MDLNQSLVKVEKVLSECLDRKPKGLYTPAAYALEVGGKRMRPTLVLLGNYCMGGNENDALHAAASVEMFHNFTLLHDDIMDNAPTRRGKPSVWYEFGSNAAILSGDAMLMLAYSILSKGPHFQTLAQCFTETGILVCEGQQMDMDFERRNDVSISDYLQMIEMKTSVLLAASLKMGAITANASVENQEKLYKAGTELGIGFQLHDDILDVFGDPNKVGKQMGGDIISNKKTYLLIKALELAQGEVLDTLMYHINAAHFEPNEKVKAVKDIYNQLSIKDLATRKMKEYFDHGLGIIRSMDIPADRKSKLLEFFELLINREH
ncbi:MAG: polyprenyl synthetase family protein [Bacteroidia bacterium]|nr:polyprenyl synthetase family protein [Bacteroidia bacterium]